MNFDAAFDRLIGIEGGYANGPSIDQETNLGITWPVLREAIMLGIVAADLTIASLKREDAKAIYKALFWERGHMDDLPGALAFQVFDFAVNSSIETALRKLQAAAGVADDGHVGPVTLAAIKSQPQDRLVMRFAAQRARFWARLSTFAKFGGGWMNRLAADLEYGAQDL